jgi:hypothetical protein
MRNGYKKHRCLCYHCGGGTVKLKKGTYYFLEYFDATPSWIHLLDLNNVNQRVFVLREIWKATKRQKEIYRDVYSQIVRVGPEITDKPEIVERLEVV